MNFEEYKKRFETFSKIDTPEKLAICESQYQHELLRLEDSKYFEPLETTSESGILGEYRKGLQEIFGLDRIASNQYHFLILPSFDIEKLLVFEQTEGDYTITLNTLTKQYWATLYQKDPAAVEKNSFVTVIESSFGIKLHELMKQVLSEAKEPKAKGIVLDGVIYHLTGFVSGKPTTVTKHSPDETSKSGKVISLMEQIAENVGQLSDTIVQRMKIEVDSLLLN